MLEALESDPRDQSGLCAGFGVPTPKREYGFQFEGRPPWRRTASWWSATESTMHPFDRDVISAIREFDRDFVPLVLYTEYEAQTGEVRLYEHHALAYVDRDPLRPRLKRRIVWPSSPGSVNSHINATTADVVVERVLEGPTSDKFLPGDFRPIGWGVYHQLKAAHVLSKNAESVEKEAWADLEAEAEAKAKAQARIDDEIDYRVESNASQIKRVAESMTHEEWRRAGSGAPA